jgi:hypothetical protein
MMIYTNNLINIQIEKSEIPWLKIFTNEKYKEFSQCPNEVKLEIFKCLDIIEKEMIKRTLDNYKEDPVKQCITALNETVFNKLNKDYTFENLTFLYLGSNIAGSYHENQIIYKQDAIDHQVRLLDEVDQNMMFINPLSYVFNYAKYIVDLPVEATLYSIVDYQIPLIQLVLSGFVDYSSKSLNLPNDRSVDYQFLKLIETGSNVKYTLTYDDSRELLNTEYNYFMSTHYKNWLDIIEEQVKKLDQLGIHQGYLVDHERVANNVYRVTYSHGLKIIINYNLSPVIVGSFTVPSVGYIVEEV